MRSEVVEFVEPPAGVRTYATRRRVHLNDVSFVDHLQLEPLARYLQDVATDDALDAGLASIGGLWVVRKLELRLLHSPRYNDEVELLTFCSGTGRSWAERRTRVTSNGRVVAEAAALWVLIDQAGGRPIPLNERFFELSGQVTRDRKVSPRLSHPGPADAAEARRWTLRASDFDLLDHVNNARYLEAVEDELARRLPVHRPTAVSAEFRGAVERGDDVELRSQLVEETDRGAVLWVWLTTDGAVRMSARVEATTDGVRNEGYIAQPRVH